MYLKVATWYMGRTSWALLNLEAIEMVQPLETRVEVTTAMAGGVRVFLHGGEMVDVQEGSGKQLLDILPAIQQMK